MRVEFEMEQKMCSNCRKISPEYYELKVQIRSIYYDDLELIKQEIINLIRKHFVGTTINKLTELDNGFDIYFASRGLINKVSSIFQKRYLVEEKRTKKIVGRNFLESKDIWRYVLLLNIINLGKGDQISVKGEEYYIKALNGHDLVLRHCVNGSKKVISYEISKEYLKLIDKNAKNWKLED